MKKNKMILLLVVLGLMFVVTACVPTPNLHSHTYDANWNSDSTHHWHGATCEHTNEKTEYAEHDWDQGVVMLEATCQAPGKKVFTCSVCEKTKEEVIAKLEHSYEDHEAKAPTCTEAGWNAYQKCVICGSDTKSEIPAKGHAYTAAFSWTSDFSACNVTLTCSNDAEHVVTKAATVTYNESKGLYVANLLYEDVNYNEEKANLNIHNFGEWNSPVAATCEAEGKLGHYYCSHCSSYFDAAYSKINDVIVPAKGHDFSAVFNWNNDCSKCTVVLTCKNDNSHIKEVDAIITSSKTDAKCDAEGKAIYTAKLTYGGKEYSDVKTVVLPMKGHSYNKTVTSPTCETGGYTINTCSNCGHSYKSDEVAALNHDYVNHNAKAATCTEAGWQAYQTCSRCDLNTKVETPALNHDYVNHDAKAATCTEAGWNAYQTCSRCNLNTKVETPALNHDYVNHNAKAATCTEAGWNAYQACSRCSVNTKVEVPALGHNYTNVVVTAPTCTNAGYTTHSCSRSGCNSSYTDTPTAAKGHSYTNYTKTHTSTCTGQTSEVATCNNGCGATDSRTVSCPVSVTTHNGTYTNNKWTCCGSAISATVVHAPADYNSAGFQCDINGTDGWEIEFYFLNEGKSYDGAWWFNYVMDIYSLTPSPWASGGWSFRSDWFGWGPWTFAPGETVVDGQSGSADYYDDVNSGTWAGKFHEASSNMNVRMNIKFNPADGTITVSMTYHSNVNPYSAEDKNLVYKCTTSYRGGMGIALGANGSKISIYSVKVIKGSLSWQSKY